MSRFEVGANVCHANHTYRHMLYFQVEHLVPLLMSLSLWFFSSIQVEPYPTDHQYPFRLLVPVAMLTCQQLQCLGPYREEDSVAF